MEQLSLHTWFEWRASWWLLGLLLPLVVWGYQAWLARKTQLEFAQPQFWRWVLVRKSKNSSPNLVLVLAWSLLIIALAGPRLATEAQLDDRKIGVDLLVVLDASKSMLADDLKPSRFSQAQTLLESLANRLGKQHRIGLLVYSYQAHWASFLSQDKNLFKRNLFLLAPEMLPYAASQSFDALQFALEQLQLYQQAPANILLVADSLQSAGDLEIQQLKQSFSAQNIQLHLLVAGKTSPVFLVDEEHPSGWLHYEAERANLAVQAKDFKDFASSMAANLFWADGSSKLLDDLVEHIQANSEAVASDKAHVSYQDFGIYFAWFGLLSLILLFKLPSFFKSFWQLKASIFGLAFVSLLVADLQTNQAWSQQKSQQTAYDAMDSRNFDRAEALFKQMPDKFEGAFGAGQANLVQGKFLPAIDYFKQAILQANTDQQRAQALFALAETFGKAKLFALAIEAAQATLLYQPDFPIAADYLAWLQEQQILEQVKKPVLNQSIGESDRQEHNPDVYDPEAATGFGHELTEEDFAAEKDQQYLVRERAQQPANTSDTSVFANFSVVEQIMDSAQLLEQINQQRMLQGLAFDLDQLKDDQAAILQHLFEREAGFQAKQAQPHQLPGVAPW